MSYQLNLSNGNRGRETPDPIPNSEAKPVFDMCVLPVGGKAYCCLALSKFSNPSDIHNYLFYI